MQLIRAEPFFKKNDRIHSMVDRVANKTVKFDRLYSQSSSKGLSWWEAGAQVYVACSMQDAARLGQLRANGARSYQSSLHFVSWLFSWDRQKSKINVVLSPNIYLPVYYVYAPVHLGKNEQILLEEMVHVLISMSLDPWHWIYRCIFIAKCPTKITLYIDETFRELEEGILHVLGDVLNETVPVKFCKICR